MNFVETEIMLKNRIKKASPNTFNTKKDDHVLRKLETCNDGTRTSSSMTFKDVFVRVLVVSVVFVVLTIVPYHAYDEESPSSSNLLSSSSSSAMNWFQQKVLPRSSSNLKSGDTVDCAIQISQSRQNITAWPPSCVVDPVTNGRNQVIIITVNCGYLDMADNYIHSLLKFNVTNFIIVAMDPIVEDVMEQEFPGHVVPIMPGQHYTSTKRSSFMMGGFKTLTSFRPQILFHFLQKGYTIFYNDIDMVWLGNAWKEFDDLYDETYTENNSISAVFTDDVPSGDVCSCMIFMKPTLPNKDFLMEWHAEIVKDNPKGAKAIQEHKKLYDRTDKAHKPCNHDQCFLNRVIFRNGNNGTQYFPPQSRKSSRLPSGRQYFERYDHYDPQKAWVAHNNWVLTYDAKVNRFQRKNMWNPMLNLSSVNCSASIS